LCFARIARKNLEIQAHLLKKVIILVCTFSLVILNKAGMPSLSISLKRLMKQPLVLYTENFPVKAPVAAPTAIPKNETKQISPNRMHLDALSNTLGGQVRICLVLVFSYYPGN
jgi:hypothetical protein